jgi:hypothetical protein
MISEMVQTGRLMAGVVFIFILSCLFHFKCFIFNSCIFRTMTQAILSSGTGSKSTVSPPTRIQCRDMFLAAGRSAQAIGQPQTKIAISHRLDGRSVVNLQPGGSNFSISLTNPDRSICGLQPPQYFTPIKPMSTRHRYEIYLYRMARQSLIPAISFASFFLYSRFPWREIIIRCA